MAQHGDAFVSRLERQDSKRLLHTPSTSKSPLKKKGQTQQKLGRVPRKKGWRGSGKRGRPEPRPAVSPHGGASPHPGG